MDNSVIHEELKTLKSKFGTRSKKLDEGVEYSHQKFLEAIRLRDSFESGEGLFQEMKIDILENVLERCSVSRDELRMYLYIKFRVKLANIDDRRVEVLLDETLKGIRP